jgi:hypothetical protein
LFLSVSGVLTWGALSDERTGHPFKIAPGPRQRSHSRVRVPWDSPIIFNVSDLRLPFCRLLRLTGSWWMYSTAPPHEIPSISKIKVKVTLRLTSSQSVSLGWCSLPDICYSLTVTVLFLRGDERTGLCFVYDAGPRQFNLSRVRVPWDSWRYFTVSELRLPFSSPFATPPSPPPRALVLYSRGTDNAENTVVLLCNADHTENTSQMIAKHCWCVTSLLLRRCLEAGGITPLFSCCVHVSRGVYRAWQFVSTSPNNSPSFFWWNNWLY